MNVGIGLLATRDVQVFSFGCSGADKYGVVPFVQNALKALYSSIEYLLYTHVQYVIDLLVQHSFRQSKRGYLTAHKTAAFGVFIV